MGPEAPMAGARPHPRDRLGLQVRPTTKVPCDAHLERYSVYQDPTNHALESRVMVRLP
jgi:hypothetical protein